MARTKEAGKRHSKWGYWIIRLRNPWIQTHFNPLSSPKESQLILSSPSKIHGLPRSTDQKGGETLVPRAAVGWKPRTWRVPTNVCAKSWKSTRPLWRTELPQLVIYVGLQGCIPFAKRVLELGYKGCILINRLLTGMHVQVYILLFACLYIEYYRIIPSSVSFGRLLMSHGPAICSSFWVHTVVETHVVQHLEATDAVLRSGFATCETEHFSLRKKFLASWQNSWAAQHHPFPTQFSSVCQWDFKDQRIMWLKQCHKPSASHHFFFMAGINSIKNIFVNGIPPFFLS